MPNYMNTHRKNFLKEQVSTKRKIEAGHIVRFSYSGKNVHTPRPVVLVLNPDWQKNLHGLTLDYIPESTLQKLYEIIKETKVGRIKKLLNLRLPLLKPEIYDPYKFYHSRLKQFIERQFPKGESPYRQFNVSGISNVRIIDYRFKDMYLPKENK